MLIGVALALVTGLGWLTVFSLMRCGQTVVPDESLDDLHPRREVRRAPRPGG